MSEQFKDLEGALGYAPANPNYMTEALGDDKAASERNPNNEKERTSEELASVLGAPGVNEASGRNPFDLTDEDREEIAARQQVGLVSFDGFEGRDRNIPIPADKVTDEIRYKALGSPDNPNSIYDFHPPAAAQELSELE